MKRLIKFPFLIAGVMLASSVWAQSAKTQSNAKTTVTKTQAKATQGANQNNAAQANARSNQGMQAAKNRVENVTNYGTVKSSNTYTVNKSTDQAQVIREQNAIERQRQKDLAKKYPATGKPVPAPGR